jgi:lysylphosphatidylglycerol synthetase-like protein (DUF2156 family)
MNGNIIPTILWLLIGVIIVAYILRHNIGRVLRGILIFYACLGVIFAVLLIALDYQVLTRLYHFWVTALLFIVIMLVLALGGR